MKKVVYLIAMVMLLAMASCSGYNPEKCEKVLAKNASEMTAQEVEFLLDQAGYILESIPEGDVNTESIKKLNEESKISMLGRITTAYSIYRGYALITGKEVPESVDRKFEKLMEKAKALHISLR